jgi:hypothetical protein
MEARETPSEEVATSPFIHHSQGNTRHKVPPVDIPIHTHTQKKTIMTMVFFNFSFHFVSNFVM